MVYVFLADGFEEIEALTPVDIMRRAGVEVFTVGIGGESVTGSHGITVIADLCEQDLVLEDNCTGIVLPGGLPGTTNLEASSTVLSAIDYCNNNGMMIAAICAAPSILGHKGILNGKKAVCYSGYESELTGAHISDTAVVTDGNIITACGAGVSVRFAFEIVRFICNDEIADKLECSMLCDR
ncbi:MAG: DJ-1/PfpI family protein [bacterium]|nr:DJ-1/PfpI family protein [bacterium]